MWNVPGMASRPKLRANYNVQVVFLAREADRERRIEERPKERELIKVMKLLYLDEQKLKTTVRKGKNDFNFTNTWLLPKLALRLASAESRQGGHPWSIHSCQ